MLHKLPIKLLLCLVIITIYSCQVVKHNQVTIHNTARLDSIINNYVHKGYYPCIYARIENSKGELLYEHSSVNTSLLPNKNIDGDTWFRIWSMSKIVTISLVLDLVEKGLISLNDPVTKFIPEFKNLKVAVSENGKPIPSLTFDEINSACPYKLVPVDSVMTVLHLINHQSGFYYAVTGKSCLDSLVASKELPTSKNSQEYINRISELPLILQPGSSDFYGTNTTILGFVAERATGKDLKELIELNITTPLNIKGLQYSLPPDVTLLPTFSGKDSLLRYAQPGELNIYGQYLPDYDPTHKLYLGGEGMLATTKGYMSFLRMLLNNGRLNGVRFLNKKTVEDIHSPHTQLNNPYGYNGYNLWISGDSMRINQSGDAGLWIGGGYEGTHFWVDPKRKIVGTIMSQMSFTKPEGNKRDDVIRGAIYQQFWADEKKKK